MEGGRWIMSKTIDERVVSMQFDNSKFERNVSTTMSTIDKLKAKLNFKGIDDSFNTISNAAGKVNMTSLGSAVDTVKTKFSALEVMGVTALANITNSAVNAGKRMISALTIYPISDGFDEYEMTLNTIQTTMAGTGKTAKEVGKEIKKLDEYADLTVYSSSDMFNNLPKFTNAGVELGKATTAMIGIANATALAGGGANQASIAFYNLGQAIGTGYLSRMDYNSINNAGIATMEWKNQMVEAAIAQGTLTKVGEDAYKSGKKTYTLQQLFIDGLQTQWATTDVMMKVFGDYGDKTTDIGKKAYASAQDVKTFSMMMESLKASAGTGWKDTWEIIFGDLEEAKKFWTGLTNFISGILDKTSKLRNNFLTKVLRTSYNPFSSLLDKFNESGIGKFTKNIKEVSKNLQYYQKVVNDVWRGDYKNSDTGRYELLDKAGYNHKVIQDLVNKGYKYKLTVDDITKSEKKYGDVTKKTSKSVDKTAASIENMSDKQLKNKGFTADEIKMLRELQKQSKSTGKSINELLKDMETADGRTLLIDAFKNIGESLKSVAKNISKAWNDIFPNSMSTLALQLYNVIKSFNEFSKKLLINKEQADELRRTFKGLFAILDMVSTLTAGPLKIAFKVIKGILGAFNIDVLEMTAKIGDAIVKFDEWLKSFIDFEKIFQKMVPYVYTFVLAIIVKFSELKAKVEPIIKQIIIIARILFDLLKNKFEELKAKIGPTIKLLAVLIKVLSESLADGVKKAYNSFKDSDLYKALNRLTSGIANIIKTSSTAIKNAADFLLPCIKSKIEDIKNVILFFFDGLIPGIKEKIEKIHNLVKFIFEGIKVEEAGENTVLGYVKGIKNGTFSCLTAISTLAADIINRFCDLLGIHSPSVVFQKLGEFCVKGFAIGTKSMVNVITTGVIDPIKAKLSSAAKNISELFTKIFGKSPTENNGNAETFENTGENLMESAATGIKEKASVVINAVKMAFNKIKEFFANLNWSSIFASGMSVAVLYITKQLIGMIQTLTSPLEGLNGVFEGVEKILKKSASGVRKILKSFAKDLKARAFQRTASGIKELAKSIAILVGSLVVLTRLVKDPNFYKALGAFTFLVAILAGLAIAISVMSKKAGEIEYAKQQILSISDLGTVLLKIAASLLIVAIAFKKIGSMETGNYIKGLIGTVAMIGAMSGLLAVMGHKLKGKTAQNADKIAYMMIKIAAALRIMASVMKVIGNMTLPEIGKAAVGLGAFLVVVGVLSEISKKLGNKSMDKMGDMILKLSGALALMAIAVKILGKMDRGIIIQGGIAVAAFVIVVQCLAKIAEDYGPSQFSSLGKTIAGIAGAMLLMSIVVKILGGMDFGAMVQGLVGIYAFVGVVKLLVMTVDSIKKDAPKIVGTLIGISIAIGIMAGIAVLLGIIPIGNLIKGIAAVTYLSLFVDLMMYAASKSEGGKKSLTAMAVCIGIMAASVAILSIINPASLALSVGALTFLMLTIAGVLLAAGSLKEDSKKATGVILLMSGIVVLFAGILTIMSKLDVQSSLANATALVGMLAAVVIAIAILNSLSGKADTKMIVMLLAVSAAIVVLAAAMLMLSSIPADKMSQTLILLATAVGVLVVAIGGLAILGVIAKAFPEVGIVAAALIGILLSLSVVMIAFSAGLYIVGLALPKIGVGLTAIGEGLKNLIAYVASCKGTIGDFAAVMVTLGTTVYTFLLKIAVGLLAFGSGSVVAGVGALALSVGIIALSSSVLIASVAVLALAAAFYVLGKSLNVTVEAVSAGRNLVLGFASGIVGSIGTIVDTVKGFCSTVIGSIKNFLGIHSPSTVAKELGKNTGEGYKEGLDESKDGVKESAENLAKSAKDGLNKTSENTSEAGSKASSNFLNSFSENMDLSKLSENFDLSSLTSSFGQKGSDSGTSFMNSFSENMDLSKLSENFDLSSLTSSFRKGGTDATKELSEGISSGTQNAQTAANKVAQSAANEISSTEMRDEFTNAGIYLVQGFANGITAATWRAQAKATVMARLAKEAAEKELGEHSPSKVFYKIGAFAGIGFINALDDYADKSERASAEMAGSAIGGLKDSISKISSLIENGMDTQPTIRPIVDLTDVRSGVNAIDGMISRNRNIGFNVGGIARNAVGISKIMNNRQNVNGDVVDAVESLRNSVSNLKPGNTYSINGITYDDGSNVANAIETLVRAAKIERRV